MPNLRTDSDTGETVDQLFRRNCGADRGMCEWSRPDPADDWFPIRFSAKTYALAVALAAALFLVLYPFAH